MLLCFKNREVMINQKKKICNMRLAISKSQKQRISGTKDSQKFFKKINNSNNKYKMKIKLIRIITNKEGNINFPEMNKEKTIIFSIEKT